MTERQRKVLETLDRLGREMPMCSWWFSGEIAKSAGLNPKGMGGAMASLAFDAQYKYVDAEYDKARRQFRYRINAGGRRALGLEPASTVSHVTLPASPEAEALYARLVEMPAAEALAELARAEPWWMRDAVLRVAGR